MANDSIHRQEFRIRDLATRSVLLFPTRAQIIRDIKEITLQPGLNQIVIDGLGPTVDEHSIKVEGTGSATITDVSVDFLPNRELYEDVYPSDDDDEYENDDEDESEPEQEAMTAIAKKIKQLNVSLLKEQEIINSAATRLSICDNFGKSFSKDTPPPSELEKMLVAYNDERAKIYEDHEAATEASGKVRKQIEKAEKDRKRLAKAMVKANEKMEKQKAKAKMKEFRKKAEIAKEKWRIKVERESFWPKKVYRVTINLEPSCFTPGSSRRTSLDGDTIVNLATSTFHEQPATPLKSDEINISLSYITYSASWSPRYDLSLNTVNCSGLLEYGAELKNSTSETWKDAKVVLSTSQTNFSGLSEKIPTMHSWHVRLLKGFKGGNADSALMSQRELEAKQKEWSNSIDQAQKPRSEVFGRDNVAQNSLAPPKASHSRPPQPATSHPSGVMFGSRQSQAVPANSSALFGNSVTAVTERGERLNSLGAAKFRSSHIATTSEELGSNITNEEYYDDGPDSPANNSLAFEAGAWEESGMTTTYDVPSHKTLSPSNSTIKHKIAKIEFKNIIFSHIVIGKLRQVAFLKARLRNSSKITLLKGPLGLTLDNSFLGQATFPRCSAGESFSLPLGVDPSIQITYPKPTVRRSQTGIFSKEESNIFARSIVIMNTKHNAPCELTVLDQVPVSEDERLRIEIISPRGLKIGGDPVRTGASVLAGLPQASVSSIVKGNAKGNVKDVRASVYVGDGKEALATQGKWGIATATTKKGGEVSWNVKLNPGQGVKLLLEYEAAFPNGEMVVGVSGHN
ncbi:Uncharacterized protein BP5553_04243 [Venustampulla echinocandica]|uniref:Mucoidy inhibitor A n=1 Tax=Venustampulla echinocandica TaxID=2656787 RepID=A0A370TWK1_9HELO|nr:Uncharacterized protein BP5553_04243 [Venustampulla echinocandica]RDL39903.1 Uncharacterized protein BP5553_04243 [Venustampulla echinocandica]